MPELIIGVVSVAVGLLFWTRARWVVEEWDRGWSWGMNCYHSHPYEFKEMRAWGASRFYIEGYYRAWEVDPSDRLALPPFPKESRSYVDYGKGKR